MFTRERKFQTKKNKEITNLTHLSYTTALPSALMMVILSIIVKQWVSFAQTTTSSILADLPSLLLILLSTALTFYILKSITLYIKFMHNNKSKNE